MKWEDPPESGGFEKKKNVYMEEAAELRSHPGEWGVVDTFPRSRDAHARSVSNNITKGKYVAFRPAGAFDAVSRKGTDDDGTPVVKVYGRYLKEEAGDSETYR